MNQPAQTPPADMAQPFAAGTDPIQQAIPAMLIGAGRADLPRPQDPRWASLIQPAEAPPEQKLLRWLAAASIAWRAGFPLPHAPATPPILPCPKPSRPTSTPTLRQLMSAALTEEPSLVPELCAVLVARQMYAWPEHIPALLDQASQLPAASPTRRQIVMATGEVGAWLAPLNPRWLTLVRAESALELITRFENATGKARVEALQALRLADPEKAIQTLEACWNDEPSDLKPRLMETLSIQPGLYDEPFLEARLNDKRKQTREVALQRLQLLKGTAFWDRQRACLAGVARMENGKLVLTPPREPTQAMLRDGVDPQNAPRNTARSEWLVKQLVRYTDLGFWTDLIGPDIPQTLDTILADQTHAYLFESLCETAVLQKHPGWCQALFEKLPQFSDSAYADILLGLAPAPWVDELLTHRFSGTDHAAEEKLVDMLMRTPDRRWSASTTRHVLDWFDRLLIRKPDLQGWTATRYVNGMAGHLDAMTAMAHLENPADTSDLSNRRKTLFGPVMRKLQLRAQIQEETPR